MDVTLERPVLRRRRSFAIRRRGITRPVRARASGVFGSVQSALLSAGARLRRPVLYLGAGAAVCHGAWQIWEPLGSIAIAGCLLLAESMTGPAPEDEQ